MPKFNLENYETVEDRLKVFWKDHPEARIETEILHITPDGQCVTIQASVFKQDTDARPVSMGIAQETKGQGGFANSDAWMENCETSAIGRALANWKYQGSNKPRPSREEMSKVQVEKKKIVEPTKQEKESMKKILDEMVAEPKESSNVGDQLNTLLTAMVDDEATRNKIKKNVYKELVDSGIASPEIKNWTKSNMDTFMQRAEDMYQQENENSNPIEEVFGEVEDKSPKTCVECNVQGFIEDNREKKEQDPEKYGKIPDFTCSNYKSNGGCGKAWWINNAPEEWL